MQTYPQTVLHPPIAVQVLCHVRTALDPLIQPKHPVVLAALLHLAQRLGKCKQIPVHALEQYQIRVRDLAAIEPLPAARGRRLEHALEIAEELGQAVLDVVVRLALGFGFLVLVVEADADGVVGVVRLVGQAVECRQSERVDLVDPVRVAFGTRREAQSRAEIHEDV